MDGGFLLAVDFLSGFRLALRFYGWLYKVTVSHGNVSQFGGWFGLTAESPLVWSCVQGEMRDLHGNEISVWPDAKYTHWSTEEVYEAIALRVIARRSGSRVTEDLLRFITADVFAEAEGLDVRVAHDTAMFVYQCIRVLRGRERLGTPADASSVLPTRIW